MLGHRRQRASPARHVVELLTREGCSLCREAEHAAQAVFGRAAVRLTDITTDRTLEDEYVFRIPVLRWRGVVVAEGRITRADALRARGRVCDLAREADQR